MRGLAAVAIYAAAMLILTAWAWQGHATPPKPYIIHDRPYYVVETTVCLWSRDDGSDLRCRTAPETEYPSRGSCMETEWGLVRAFAAMQPDNVRVGARVRCIQSYDA